MQCSIMHQILCPKFAFFCFFMVEIYEKLFVKPRFCPALVHVYMHPHYIHQPKPCELLSLKHTILYSDHIFIMNPALEFYVCLLLKIDNYNHCFSSLVLRSFGAFTEAYMYSNFLFWSSQMDFFVKSVISCRLEYSPDSLQQHSLILKV